MSDLRAEIGWAEADPRKILAEDGFQLRLSFLSPDDTIVFTDGIPRANGLPTYIFAVLSTVDRELVIDLIEAKDGRKLPMVAGKYDQALRHIRPGMSLIEVYSMLGHEQCDFHFDNQRGWIAEFCYRGFGGTFFTIEVDGATGIVLRCVNSTI